MESNEHVRALMSRLKELNSEHIMNTEVVMVDKNIVEIEAISAKFVSATILLCRVHTERTFKSLATQASFSSDDMKNLQPGETTVSVSSEIRGLLHMMLVSETESEFDEYFTRFWNDIRIPEKFKQNFRKNWYSIRKMWAICLRQDLPTFGVNTTNNLENRNGEIKLYFESNFPSMADCLENLIVFRDLHQQKIKFEDYKYRSKVPRVAQCSESEIYRLAYTFCTNKAAEHILAQAKIAENFRIETFNVSSDCVCRVKFHEIPEEFLIENERLCSCDIFKQNLLPCCHVLAVRQHQSLPLLEKAMVIRRYDRNATPVSVKCPSFESASDLSINTIVPIQIKSKAKSCVQKESEVKNLLRNLPFEVSTVGQDGYHSTLQELTKMSDFVAEGKKFRVVSIDDDFEHSCSLTIEKNISSKPLAETPKFEKPKHLKLVKSLELRNQKRPPLFKGADQKQWTSKKRKLDHTGIVLTHDEKAILQKNDPELNDSLVLKFSNIFGRFSENFSGFEDPSTDFEKFACHDTEFIQIVKLDPIRKIYIVLHGQPELKVNYVYSPSKFAICRNIESFEFVESKLDLFISTTVVCSRLSTIKRNDKFLTMRLSVTGFRRHD